MLRQNKKWQAFRDRLPDNNYLWSIEGSPRGLDFDLVCIHTVLGITIFQVWPEDFIAYASIGPNNLKELLSSLTQIKS